MKQKRLVLRSLLIVFILSISLLGCAKESTEVADVPEVEAEIESVQEETVVQGTETEDVQEEPETTVEEAGQQEEQPAKEESLGSASIWEDVKETDDICIVVLDENAGEQKIINSTGIGAENAAVYVMEQQGNKILIPLRDNVRYITRDTDKSETFYSISSVGVDYPIVDINGIKAIEMEDIPNEYYNIMIYTTDTDDHIEFVIIHD